MGVGCKAQLKFQNGTDFVGRNSNSLQLVGKIVTRGRPDDSISTASGV